MIAWLRTNWSTCLLFCATIAAWTAFYKSVLEIRKLRREIASLERVRQSVESRIRVPTDGEVWKYGEKHSALRRHQAWVDLDLIFKGTLLIALYSLFRCTDSWRWVLLLVPVAGTVVAMVILRWNRSRR